MFWLFIDLAQIQIQSLDPYQLVLISIYYCVFLLVRLWQDSQHRVALNTVLQKNYELVCLSSASLSRECFIPQIWIFFKKLSDHVLVECRGLRLLRLMTSWWFLDASKLILFFYFSNSDRIAFYHLLMLTNCLIEILRGESLKPKWSWHRRRVKAILKTRKVFLLLLQGRSCLLWLESTQASGVTWSAINLEGLGCHEVISPSLLWICSSSNNDFTFSRLLDDALKKLEERGVVIRFVIGRRFSYSLSPSFSFFLLLAMFFSLCLNHMGEIILMLMLYKFSSANRGDSLDRKIDQENLATKDFLILVSKNNPFSYFSFRCLLIWI